MRMRRKKHLEERLADCAANLLCPALPQDRDFRQAEFTPDYLDADTWFEQQQPLWLEIGCGKGQFAVELAQRHPEINLLAVEKVANVVVAAAEKGRKAGLPNLRFLQCGAEYLPRYLPPHTVQRLFLNFSCPYPKKRYAGHRLTAPQFLSIYDRLLAPGAEIHQKTDNRSFFEYSIEQLSAYGFLLKNVSLDLHHSDFEGNIVTEYEQRFVSLGQPIYRLEAHLRELSQPLEIVRGDKILQKEYIEKDQRGRQDG